jgi:hypothetical protein
MSDLSVKIEGVEAAVARADDRLEFLSRIPQADTASAQRAVDGLRLEILDEFATEVRAAVGGSAGSPVAAVPDAAS